MDHRSRELTAAERREICKLVKECSSYHHEYGCLPLDGKCYMLNKWWTGNLCRYFEGYVLPENPILEHRLKVEPITNTKSCSQCGRKFIAKGRKSYCSERCAAEGRKAATAARVRKHRRNRAEM